MSSDKWKIKLASEDLHSGKISGKCPCGRDIWGGSFVYGTNFYIFGGAYEEFGLSSGHGDLSTMGVLDDLWKYDTLSGKWTNLHPNDGLREYGSAAKYPGARVLPSLSVVGDCAYLFGGLTVIEKKFVTRALNDLWRYDIEKDKWELLSPDTGVVTYDSRPTYPSCRCATSSGVIGTSIYIFGGWPGVVPVFLLNDFWRYDTVKDHWEQIHPHDGSRKYDSSAIYPGTRYCAASGVYGNNFYLFSGRDTNHRQPEFFNDLWQYDTKLAKWTLLHPDDASKDFGPSASYPAGRYGSMFASVGSKFFLFGGHNMEPIPTERNDFWVYDMGTNQWEMLLPDNGSQDYSDKASRPGVRRVGTMARVNDSLLLFGGFNLYAGSFENGFVKALNDLWVYQANGK